MDLDDAASVTSQPLPHIQASMFGQPQPRALSKGQTPFNWDVTGQKTYDREDVPPEVEDRLRACENAAQMLAVMGLSPRSIRRALRRMTPCCHPNLVRLRCPRQPSLYPVGLGMPGRRPVTLMPLGDPHLTDGEVRLSSSKGRLGLPGCGPQAGSPAGILL